MASASKKQKNKHFSLGTLPELVGMGLAHLGLEVDLIAGQLSIPVHDVAVCARQNLLQPGVDRYPLVSLKQPQPPRLPVNLETELQRSLAVVCAALFLEILVCSAETIGSTSKL